MAGGLILLDGVWRTYTRGQVVALRGLTLSIERGDYLAITGPSGSGKSTLLYLAGGLDRPSQGRVLFDGVEPKVPARWTALRARRIGFVFQSFHLISGLTAAENVEIAMFGVERNEQRRMRKVAELLDRVRLSHRLHHRISELSAGESQRVAIARALANGPEIVLADEPTGNLDAVTGGGIMELLNSLNENQQLTIVMVTHDEAIAAQAHRTVRLA
ncbi:MAG: ABC transporter ATP-binding protein, partial [Acidobacteria bacterium]|nr:ABC transporter ATP-binding protein [Acidobacteriota bacterium]